MQNHDNYSVLILSPSDTAADPFQTLPKCMLVVRAQGEKKLYSG